VISFTPQPLYPRGRAPRTHRIAGWVGPRACLDIMVIILKLIFKRIECEGVDWIHLSIAFSGKLLRIW